MEKITTREKEVLTLNAYEHSSKEIANRHYVSYETVNSNRKNLLRKMNIKNTVGLVRAGFQQDILRLSCLIAMICNMYFNINAQATFEMLGGDAQAQGAAAIGEGTLAQGKSSMALGLNTSALADYSFVVGAGATVGPNGYGGISMGSSYNNSPFSVTLGINNIAQPGSDGSAIFGAGNSAWGASSLVSGQENTAYSFAETVIGQYAEGYTGATPTVSKVLTDRLFTIGNGSSSSDRSNAMVVYKSGDLELYGRLSLLSNHNVLFGVDSTGAGNRTYWISEKGAFRAGGVFDDIFDINTGQEGAEYWDPVNIGDYSVAFGQTNLSKGNHTMAWGGLNTANQAYSSVWGNFNEANAENSTVWGQYNIAKGKGSTVLGIYNVANSFLETVIGQFADSPTSSSADSWMGDDMVFVVGNGTAENDRKNALTVLKNGNIGIDESNPKALLHIASDGDVLFGDSLGAQGFNFLWMPSRKIFRVGDQDLTSSNESIMGDHSVVLGQNVTATGVNSTGFGLANTVNGNISMVWGNGNNAIEYLSTAWGQSNKAGGLNSTVWGEQNSAGGKLSTVFGNQNFAQSYAETVIGQYADTISGYNFNSWDINDRLFVIGNGTDDANRSNALTILKNGNIEVSGKISNLSDPVANQDAATKAYVDNSLSHGSYVPTWATVNGFTEDPSCDCEYSRVGDMVTVVCEFGGSLTFGSGQNIATITVPTGLNIDGRKVSGVFSSDHFRNSGNTNTGIVCSNNSSTVRVQVNSSPSGVSAAWCNFVYKTTAP